MAIPELETEDFDSDASSGVSSMLDDVDEELSISRRNSVVVRPNPQNLRLNLMIEKVQAVTNTLTVPSSIVSSPLSPHPRPQSPLLPNSIHQRLLKRSGSCNSLSTGYGSVW